MTTQIRQLPAECVRPGDVLEDGRVVLEVRRDVPEWSLGGIGGVVLYMGPAQATWYWPRGLVSLTRVLTCPLCGEPVWDGPRGYKLAKCWNFHPETDGTLAFDTMEDDDES